MSRKQKNNVKTKSKSLSVDSKEWKVPMNPPETSYAQFPFTIQGALLDFEVAKGDNDKLTYSGVLTAFRRTLTQTAMALSFRVTHVAVYGNTSTLNTDLGTKPSQADYVAVEDAYTGREVRGSSTPTVRARAGIALSPLKAMKWYNSANFDSIPEKDIVYIRTGMSSACLPDDSTQAYTIVVRGFCRIPRRNGSC